MKYYPPASDSVSTSAAGASGWRRLRPGSEDQRASHLFWVMVVALGWISLLGVTWGAARALAKNSAEKPLQMGLILPKLNSSHGARKAEAFHLSTTQPNASAQPKDRDPIAFTRNLPVVVEQTSGAELEHPGFPFATSEPPHIVPDALLKPLGNVELPPALVEMCDDPVIYLKPCAPHRGDSPMIRTWKTLTLYSLLSAAAVVYVPQPLLAGGQEPKKDDATIETLNKLNMSIQELSKRIKDLEDKKPVVADAITTKDLENELKKLQKGLLGKLEEIGDDVKNVTRNVDTLNKDIASMKGEQLRQKLDLDSQKIIIEQLAKDIVNLQKKTVVAEGSPLDKAGLDEFRKRLNDIQDAIAKISTEKRLSMSMPNGTAANMGRVVLVNLYSEDILFRINGAPYRVLANTSKVVENVPVGPLSYDVFANKWGSLDNRVITLTNGETVTLTASNAR